MDIKEEHPVAAAVGGTILVSILFSVAFVAADGWLGYKDFLRGPISAWMQGIGTLAAVFAAIGLAAKQDTAKRRDELTRAQVVGVALLHQLMPTMHSLPAVVGDLRRIARIDSAMDELEWASNRLKNLSLPSQEELLLLAPIGGECAKSLARVRGFTAQASHALDTFVDEGHHTDSDGRRAAAKTAHGFASTAYSQLYAGHKALMEFITPGYDPAAADPGIDS
jgi:hypothetical protein